MICPDCSKEMVALGDGYDQVKGEIETIVTVLECPDGHRALAAVQTQDEKPTP